MLPKQFMVFFIQDTQVMLDKIFPYISDIETGAAADFFAVESVFSGNMPAEIERDISLMYSSGFTVPDQLEIEMACDPDVPVSDRCYALVHVFRQRDVDIVAIAKKCRDEMAGLNHDDIEAEVERRVTEAKSMAPIVDTRTPVFIRGDGALIIGAVGTRADVVKQDFLEMFCSEVLPVDDDHDFERYDVPDVTRDLKALTCGFNQKCFDLISRDVYGDDLDLDELDELIDFDRGFQISLPNKGKMSVDGVSQLPEGFRGSLQGADYKQIKVLVSTPEFRYHVAVTSKAEFKSLKLHSDYVLEDPAPRLVINELMSIRSAVMENLSIPEEADD